MGAVSGGIDPITGKVTRIMRELQDSKEKYADWLMGMLITHGINNDIPLEALANEPDYRLISAFHTEHIVKVKDEEVRDRGSAFWPEVTPAKYQLTEAAQRYLNVMNNDARVIEPQSIKEK